MSGTFNVSCKKWWYSYSVMYVYSTVTLPSGSPQWMHICAVIWPHFLMGRPADLLRPALGHTALSPETYNCALYIGNVWLGCLSSRRDASQHRWWDPENIIELCKPGAKWNCDIYESEFCAWSPQTTMLSCSVSERGCHIQSTPPPRVLTQKQRSRCFQRLAFSSLRTVRAENLWRSFQ